MLEKLAKECLPRGRSSLKSTSACCWATTHISLEKNWKADGGKVRIDRDSSRRASRLFAVNGRQVTVNTRNLPSQADNIHGTRRHASFTFTSAALIASIASFKQETLSLKITPGNAGVRQIGENATVRILLRILEASMATQSPAVRSQAAGTDNIVPPGWREKTKQ